MYKGQSIGVVVTAYNEQGRVGQVIETVPSYVDRIYAIDDGSTDGTWEEIAALADSVEIEGAEAERPVAQRSEVGPLTDGGNQTATRVFGIKHAENRGVGGAIKTGYRHAHEDEMNVVAVMNGDGQMDPDILQRIIDPVVDGRADYAKGDRLRTRESREGMPSWRFFGNSLLTFLTKLSSGYWKMNDSQNGYTAISLQALERIPYDNLYEDYGFLNDMLTTLNSYNLRVANVPHNSVYGDEESTIRYRTFVPKLSWLLLRNFFRRLKTRYLVLDFHPTVLCYLFGILGVVVAFVSSVFALFLPLNGVETFFAFLLTTTVFLVGAFTLSVGIAFDVEQNESLEIHSYE